MIKLLIVDDSPLMRRLLSDLFKSEGDFEVSVARNGAEALEALASVRPDVITLDVQMPEMDGLECLDRIMLLRPTPVVMASAVTAEGASEALRAIDLGAVDVIAKPSGAVSLRMDDFGPPLVEKVRAAAQARLPKSLRLRERVRARAAFGIAEKPAVPRPRRATGPAAAAGDEGLVIIGTSTGGPPALDAVLRPLTPNFAWPIVIAQHMPSTFTGALARRLDGLTALAVSEIVGPTALQPGRAYVARGDADVVISRRGGRLVAMNAPADPAFRWHPSVDRLVDSAMEQLAADRLIGVLMTGMGNDGAAGMARLHESGGHTIAESEATAVVWGMPGELVRAEGATVVADLDEISSRLLEAVPAS